MLRAGSKFVIDLGWACPGVSDSRAGFAATGPGVPGGGWCPAPSLRPPRGLPAGQASRIHRGTGQADRHTGRAGRPAAENLARSSARSGLSGLDVTDHGGCWLVVGGTIRPSSVIAKTLRARWAGLRRISSPQVAAQRRGRAASWAVASRWPPDPPDQAGAGAYHRLVWRPGRAAAVWAARACLRSRGVAPAAQWRCGGRLWPRRRLARRARPAVAMALARSRRERRATAGCAAPDYLSATSPASLGGFCRTRSER